MRSLMKKAGMLLAAISLFSPPLPALSAQFITRDHLVIDLLHGVEWLRCSVGQVWNGSQCDGKVLSLDHDQIEQAISQANEQLGGNWRLPSRAELEGLVCKDCPRPKIDISIFPDTDPVPYWTGEKNRFAPRHYWSVSFFTGDTYGRFFPTQQMAVRLVRDR